MAVEQHSGVGCSDGANEAHGAGNPARTAHGRGAEDASTEGRPRLRVLPKRTWRVSLWRQAVRTCFFRTHATKHHTSVPLSRSLPRPCAGMATGALSPAGARARSACSVRCLRIGIPSASRWLQARLATPPGLRMLAAHETDVLSRAVSAVPYQTMRSTNAGASNTDADILLC
jgi:hypothetical protein